MLTGADVAAMRRDQEEWLDQTCVVSAPVRTSDGAGSSSVAWAAAGTVACRVMPLGGSGIKPAGSEQASFASAMRDVAQWVVTLPHSFDVDTTMRFAVAGRVLEVVAVANRHSVDTATRVACVEVR